MYVFLWKTALYKGQEGVALPSPHAFFFFFKQPAALMCKRCLLLALTVCCRKLVSLERNLLRFPHPLNWVLFMTEYLNLLTESNFSPPPFLFAPKLISSQKEASFYFSCFWEWQVLHTHVINIDLFINTLLDSKNYLSKILISECWQNHNLKFMIFFLHYPPPPPINFFTSIWKGLRN